MTSMSIYKAEDVSNAQLGGVAVTIAEGGSGYWCRISRYEPLEWWPADRDPLEVDNDFEYFRVQLENPHGEGVLIVKVTPRIIREGLIRLVEGKGGVAQEYVNDAREALDEGEPGLMDAAASDIVLQLGIWGEVIFG